MSGREDDTFDAPFVNSLTLQSGVGMGDAARVRVTPVTAAAGIAGRVGTIHGHTTPSHGYVDDILGDPVDDVAVNVYFDDTKASVWLTPDLVEFIDHQSGTTIKIGDQEFVRVADGGWEKVPPEAGTGPRRP